MAPYGQGDINDLKSVFEMKHLQKGAIFLDTQCAFIRLHRLVFGINGFQIG